MAVSDVIPQDGGQGNVKLHPYLITLVRWCVSCLWSTASVLLHRLAAAPLPRLKQITADRQTGRVAKPRAAGSEHLHPEPRVQCEVLHAPAAHQLDVIFVHGLYGSLGNTWRQGEWRIKYKLDPTRVPLRNHSSEECGCPRDPHDPHDARDAPGVPAYEAQTTLDESVTLKQLNGCLRRILPQEDQLITEQFYNNTLLQGGHCARAGFVADLFKNDCDTHCDRTSCTCEGGEGAACTCAGACAAGCGCVCDDCYSHCWPRDWIREDFPGARVISVNYTSDPYLWRPLWVKGTKRLRLHERAEQMTAQLVALGVGRRPVVWVGHSKGGLFIKQIYCEAYEAHLKLNKSDNKNNNSEDQSDIERNVNNNKVHNSIDRYNPPPPVHGTSKLDSDSSCDTLLDNFIKEQSSSARGDQALRSIDDMNEIRNNFNSGNSSDQPACGREECEGRGVRSEDQYSSALEDAQHEEALSSSEEEEAGTRARAALWANSRGFMFYSVPHRGSPLADIKAPLTARSVELQEIAKDCPLVLSLQARWLAAARAARPAVRSLVETGRTLMSVLWLRIVSEDSADAGVGVLHGVSVDHREICKPASRRCPLYTELARLIRTALSHRCRC